jgi:FKBP-type peptidyl-prolyl cis-trans isomerase
MVEEAKREKEEQKRKEAEAAAELEAIPKVDISGDGGIIKQIITEGSGGGTPADGAHITAHYTGRLLDGTVFDSSVERNQPFDFDLGKGNVIKCWDQGFATMKRGKKGGGGEREKEREREREGARAGGSSRSHTNRTFFFLTGEKAYLTCQPEYAYGERAMGKIPANAVLRVS